MFKQALELSASNKAQAAEMLDLSDKALLNRLKEYEVE
jgi:DNA-binding NtrC family response regulator